MSRLLVMLFILTGCRYRMCVRVCKVQTWMGGGMMVNAIRRKRQKYIIMVMFQKTKRRNRRTRKRKRGRALQSKLFRTLKWFFLVTPPSFPTSCEVPVYKQWRPRVEGIRGQRWRRDEAGRGNEAKVQDERGYIKACGIHTARCISCWKRYKSLPWPEGREKQIVSADGIEPSPLEPKERTG